MTLRKSGLFCLTKVEVKFRTSYPEKDVIHIQTSCSLKDSKAETALHDPENPMHCVPKPLSPALEQA